MPNAYHRAKVLDGRRSVIFASAAAAAAVSAVLQIGLGHKSVGGAWWELSSMVVCGAVAALLRHDDERRRTAALVFATLFFVVTTPLVALTLKRSTDVVLLFSLPLGLAVVFIDRMIVVGVISVAALAINLPVLMALGWNTTELLHGVAVMGALYTAGVVGALEFKRVRERDDEHARQLQRASMQQVESERLVVLGRLAAGVAHEINNPLAYMKANLAFLEAAHLPANDDEREAWAETRQGLELISAIVMDLKGLARPGPSGVGSVELEEQLRRLARLAAMRCASTVKLDVEIEPHLPACRADGQRLAQVLMNLVANACDAIDGAPPACPRVKVVARRVDDRIRLEVHDNGPGVPEPQRARLFTPFFTTKPVGVGTGLGLSLSREYVEAFGGSLTYEPSSLGGACFVITAQLSESSPPR
ncbi:MAG: hypothetical protein GQE15_27780 [Archangiaceae bacterium]|nr:hypothetical protein [Archangiaceae bacterium]